LDPILRLDENKNDARIIGLSVDIVRGMDMIHKINQCGNSMVIIG
jgi:hypothetical protein